jgi:hypothetical protein
MPADSHHARKPKRFNSVRACREAVLSFWEVRSVGQRILILGVALLLVAVPTVLGSRVAYERFRNARIDENLSSAQEAAAAGNWQVARNLSRSVLIARPRSFPAFLLWQQALAELGEPSAYQVATQLFVHPQATTEQKMAAFKVISRQAPQAITRSAFFLLSDEERATVAARVGMAEVLLARGLLTEAETLLTEADGSFAPEAELVLLKVLCAKGTASSLEEARRILRGLVHRDASKHALEALMVLSTARDGLLGVPYIPELSEWVEKQASATAEHRLAAMEYEMRGAQSPLDEIVTAAHSRFAAESPLALANWLMRQDRVAAVPKLIAETAMSNNEAFLVLLEALFRLGKFDMARTVIATPPPATDPVKLELAHVSLARGTGDASAETAAWNRTLAAAALDESGNRFIEIAEEAHRIGANRISERAWVAAIGLARGRLPTYEDFSTLFDSLAAQGLSQDLLSIHQVFARIESGNAATSDNLTYLSLIHGTMPPGEVAERMSKPADSYPMEWTTAALAAVMAEKPELALEWLGKAQPLSATVATSAQAPQSSVTARSRVAAESGVIEAIALLQSNREQEGRALLQSMDWRRFMPQENAVFRKVLINLKGADMAPPESTTEPADEK